MAKSLTSAARRVGIRIPSWTTYVRDIYPGLLAYVREHATWQIETTEDTTHEIPPVRIDEDWRGDGLIVFRCTATEARAWRRRGIRVVNISSEPPGGGGAEVPTVVPDNFASGRLAAEHLLSRGLSRFACWTDPTRRYSQQRQQGFTSAVGNAGYQVETIELAVSLLPFRKRLRAIESELRRRLPQLQTPVGLFAKDDISAACIVRVCQLVGLRVPQDIAVVGCNNDPAFVYTTSPSLTSVVYPAAAIGRKAAEILDRMFRQTRWAPDEPVRVPVQQLVERESTDLFCFDDPLVSDVQAIVHRSAANQVIRVEQLADQLAVGASTLRRRFHAATGRSLKSAIDEARMRQIQERLTQTDQPVKQIAYACGFRTPEDVTRFVRRQTGLSPTQLRVGQRR